MVDSNVGPAGNTVTKTFHRRELKPPAIAFSSLEGKKLFQESLSEGNLEIYFPLAENYTTQTHPSFCGLGSLTMALNTLLVDPQRIWQGVWRWFDDSMLNCCESHEVIKLKGISLPKVMCLARCNGADATMKYSNDVTIDDFRTDVMSVCKSVDKVIILSYYRPTLNQSGSGHFSPIGGYNSNADLVLIMDVARFKYPPHWVPLELLFHSINTIDEDTKKPRGYVIISKSENKIDFDNCKNICNSIKMSIDDNNDIVPIDEINERVDSFINHKCNNCSNDTNCDH